jgi:hypothetical protein
MCIVDVRTVTYHYEQGEGRVTAALDQLISHLEQSLVLARQLRDTAAPPESDGPEQPPARVETLGKVAHLHLEHEEGHGRVLRSDSLAIRRRLYGDKIRATANLFGKKESGAVFYRDAPLGSRVRDTDRICLTEEGLRLALEYRRRHGLETAAEPTPS